MPWAGARPAPCVSPWQAAALTACVPQLPRRGSCTPSPQAWRWQWRPSASSSWLQAAGLPSGEVREWGKAGGKAEAVGVLLRGWGSGKGAGGPWGCAAGADAAWGRWLWAAQLGRLPRELGSFSLRPPAARWEPGLGSTLACAPQPLFFLQVPAEGDARGEPQGLLAGGWARGGRGHGGALGCSSSQHMHNPGPGGVWKCC